MHDNMTGSDNIVKFKPNPWNETEKQTQIDKKILFKNANLVNLTDGTTSLVDFVVGREKILFLKRAGVLSSEIFKQNNFEFEFMIYDLEGALVIPNFVNLFYDSQKAFELNFERHLGDYSLVKNLMKMKNYLAGAVISNDFSNLENSAFLEQVKDFEERDFSDFCEKEMKKDKIFLKVGQDLDELGTVDKKFNKSLPYVLEDFGILDKGGWLVGGNCFEKDDFQTFLNHDFNVLICPSEDAKLGRRPTNLVMLKNMGFKVRIASGYNFEVDFFSFMRQVLMTQRSLLETTNCLDEKDVLLMAMLGEHDSSEEIDLKIGSEASFLVLKDKPSLYDDIFKTLVWGFSKQDVMMTIEKGEIMQINGQINLVKTGWEYKAILEEIKKQIKGEENDNN